MNGKEAAVERNDVRELLKAAQKGDPAAKEELVRQNAGLVRSLVRRFTSYGGEMEDLMQIGYLGLIKAIYGFDFSFSVQFSTYAVPVILGELRRHFREDGKIKVGRQMKQEIRNLRAAKEDFGNQEGRQPRISELAKLMGCSPGRVGEIMEAENALWNMGSIDDEGSGASELPATGSDREEERRVERIGLRQCIAALAPRDRCLLLYRYAEDMTQQQVAGRLGVSQVQVSRLEKKALARLREALKE